MIENGLLNEVKKLYDYKDLGTLNTVGYKELFKYLDNDLSLDKSIDEIKKIYTQVCKKTTYMVKKFKKEKNIGMIQI